MSKPKAYLDQESSFQGKYSTQVFETLYLGYRPYIVPLVVLVSVGFASRILLLGNANMIGIWVDTLCQAPAVCRPVPNAFRGLNHTDFLWILSAMTLAGFLLTAIFRVGFSRLSSLAVSRLYDETTLRTSRLPIQFFDQNPVGRIVTRFSSDYGSVFRLFGGPLAEFFAIIFDLCAMLILISVASPFYIPILVVIALANYVVYRLNRDRLRLERRDLSASRSPSIAHFAETTQGASTIRVFSRQRTFGKRFSVLNERFLNQRLSATKALLSFSMQMSSLTALLLFMTGTLGYYLSSQGLVSIGSIGVAFTFVVLSGTSLQTFFEWLGQLEDAMTGVERLNDYLRRDLEPGARLPATRSFATSHPVYEAGQEETLKAARLVSETSAGVDVDGLWFRYGRDLPWVLKGLDFKIRPQEKIGIVGRTGSGKTSFVQALFHLYPFDAGRILIGGVAPCLDVAAGTGADLSVFRRSIALISQEPTLFRGTLRENLDLSSLHGDERLKEVLGRVGLSHWVAGQSLGLNMMIEERGKNLSAGEKQLLCMARCLLQDAPIVVMDEATSSVDPQSEEVLVRATREFFSDRTQIIIAHRLSTLDACDRILWLHKGEVRMLDKPDVVLPIFKTTGLA